MPPEEGAGPAPGEGLHEAGRRAVPALLLRGQVGGGPRAPRGSTARGRRPAAGGRGGRARLRCELCAFTCKQERCLAQHVALKHEGARPHACRFCGFSTARRYRLRATSRCTPAWAATRARCARGPSAPRPSCGCTAGGCTSAAPPTSARPATTAATASTTWHATRSAATGGARHACALCPARFSSETALTQHRLRLHREAAGPPGLPRLRPGLPQPGRPEGPRAPGAPAAAGLRGLRGPADTRDALEEHRRTHFAQRCPECPPLRCAACDFRCRHRLVLEQHVRGHGGARLYQCTDCQYSTRNRQKITWHVRVHTGEKPYRCEQCSYACADPSRLKYHMRIHQDERKYLCPECGYKCKWVNQLKYHMTKHTGAKPYACDECEYRTNRADALRIHRETRHREARGFICEECGKAFKTRFLLSTHQRKHSEARPYVCRVCRRAFRWPAGLRHHHYLTHTQRHPFHCLHCAYTAKQKFQVVKHLRRHHPEQSVERGVGRDPGPTPSPAGGPPGAWGRGPGGGARAGQDTAETNQGEGQ
ncbi:hypothetical protein ANANG_G00279730 [Anguilla anguilla]|uniref:C2H2-type domain-containing protein n=1 Tax=Anguilla anguilla TaxID=7936 RepID=A0A9D3RN79_ANGAN|nr:hypothetical protein ANANG_G00279730 [Anguilla anguilla]